MKYLPRCVVTLALVVSYFGFCSVASSQTKPAKKSPGGTISGKVTIKGKATPGIVVGLRTSQPAMPYEPSSRATTDQEGHYRLTDVPAGTYQVAPVAPAFVVSDINSRNQTVVILEGESVEGIDFALVRGGVITGKVTDAEGRPVIEQRVNLFSANQPPNPRDPTQLYPITSAQTDDRGIYRMFGLTAGRYKLAAGEGANGFFYDAVGRGPSYKETFYPDVTDPAKATVLEVTEGSEATKIDITLGNAAQTFAAGGHIIDGETTQPVAGIRLGLQLIIDPQRRTYVSASIISNSLGEFKAENLPPGKYEIFVAPQPDSDVRSEPVTFDILDQDVNGLVVKTAKGGASLSGNIVIENTDDKTVLATLTQLRVQGYVQNQTGNPSMGHTASINSDGSFFLNGLESGAAYLSLGAQDRNLLKGFIVSRIERDGIVQPRGIEIKTGDQITGVRMVINYGSATVHGIIKAENGELPASARFFVRVTKAGEKTSNIRPPQVDSRGHFIMEGLPGGVYDFVVTVAGPSPGGTPWPSAKQQVNIVDGVVNEVTITLDLSQKPGSRAP
jgi:hypothetical protein